MYMLRNHKNARNIAGLHPIVEKMISGGASE